MIATVLIGSPNGVANHLFDDRPTATVEGDFLIGLERGRCFSLSHGYSIAENGGKTSFIFVFLTFIFSLFFTLCLTRKSLSINELRRAPRPRVVTR